MKFSNIKKAVIALIIANTIWGVAAPVFKWSLESTPPFTLAVLRFSIASLSLVPFVKNKLKIRAKDFLYVFLISLFGITINVSFFFLGLTYTESINAPIIASSAPLFIIAFGAIFLKDKLLKKTIIGAILGFIGVLIIIVIPSIDQGFDGSIVGNIFFVLAMLGGVVYTLLLKKIIKNYHPLTLAFWIFFIGAITFLPMFFSEIESVGFLPIINERVIIGILFGAFLSSGLGYFLHLWALKYMKVGDVGIFTYIDPIAAVVIAVPLLGEIPTTYFFIGSAFVFIGIFIAQRKINWHPITNFFK